MVTDVVGHHKDANLIVRKRRHDNFSSRRKRIIASPAFRSVQVAGTFAFNGVFFL